MLHQIIIYIVILTFGIVTTCKANTLKIVIDPGHGGKDPGATYKQIYEKNITLMVGIELHKRLKKQKKISAILTRTTDTFVPLEQRASIVKKNEADVILSIHVNSSPEPSAKGFLVFTMEANGALRYVQKEIKTQKKEVSPILGGKDAAALLEQLGNMNQQMRLLQSQKLALLIREEFISEESVKNPHVYQDNFQVLRTVPVAAVLVELGFITNSVDRKKMTQPKYIQEVAKKLENAILNYIQAKES